jgi:hypothetical protein
MAERIRTGITIGGRVGSTPASNSVKNQQKRTHLAGEWPTSAHLPMTHLPPGDPFQDRTFALSNRSRAQN